MSSEEQGFTVKDRRHFTGEGEPRPEQEGRTTAGEVGQSPAEPQEAPGGEPARHHLPPVDFSALILSLSHAAMMHLGHIPDPMTGENSPDLELARHTIDTIGMLKEKTAGNLDQDEQHLIESALTELRMAFVRASA